MGGSGPEGGTSDDRDLWCERVEERYEDVPVVEDLKCECSETLLRCGLKEGAFGFNSG